MAMIRLCDPGSKLCVLRWLEMVALPVGVGVVSEHQHLLRAMESLMNTATDRGSDCPCSCVP